LKFEFPESMRAYCSDASIEAAVDALLTKPGKMPSDLSWEEYPAYVLAWVAAHRVMGDHALVLAQLWDALWRPVLEPAWRAATIDDQIADEKSNDPHPSALWHWEVITRTHERQDESLYSFVQLQKGSVTVGFTLFGKTGRVCRISIPGFERDPETDIWWSIAGARVVDGSIELDELVPSLSAAAAEIGRDAAG
jgi:hypothetical protein